MQIKVNQLPPSVPQKRTIKDIPEGDIFQCFESYPGTFYLKIEGNDAILLSDYSIITERHFSDLECFTRPAILHIERP